MPPPDNQGTQAQAWREGAAVHTWCRRAAALAVLVAALCACDSTSPQSTTTTTPGPTRVHPRCRRCHGRLPRRRSSAGQHPGAAVAGDDHRHHRPDRGADRLQQLRPGHARRPVLGGAGPRRRLGQRHRRDPRRRHPDRRHRLVSRQGGERPDRDLLRRSTAFPGSRRTPMRRSPRMVAGGSTSTSMPAASSTRTHRRRRPGERRPPPRADRYAWQRQGRSRSRRRSLRILAGH